MTPNPGLVIVTGPPAAGKTTVTRELARQLGFSRIAKDPIKEAICDGLGLDEIDDELSAALSRAAFETLFRILATARGAVVDANFSVQLHQRRLRGLSAPRVEVHCRCPVEICYQRYERRRTRLHRCHQARLLSLADFEACSRPLAIGPLIEIDTTARIDFDGLCRQIREILTT
jgi:predicted kinase